MSLGCKRRAVGFAMLWLWLLAACSTRPAETARGRWYEARSGHFQVWTDADAETARSLAVDLERFRQVMMAETTAEDHAAAPPLRVFVARSRHSFASLTAGGRLAGSVVTGLFVGTSSGNFAIVDGSPTGGREALGAGIRSILFHEYAHYVMAANGARVPSWYNEGFAEYMATTAFREDGSYSVGCPPRYRTAWSRHRAWVPMETVLSADSVTSVGQHDRRWTDSYAQSWYAVHYFNGDSERKAQLSRYLRLWAEGVAPLAALESAFGLDAQQLDGVLQDYSARRRFACVAITPAKPLAIPTIVAQPLSEGDAHQRIGDFVLSMMGPTEAAFEVLERAAVLQPNDAATLLTLARAHLLRGTRDQDLTPDQAENELRLAARYLRQGSQRASGSPQALLLEGHLLRLQAQRLATSKQLFSEPLLAARGAYRRAIRGDETLAEAYLGLGNTYLIHDNGSDEAVVALEAAAYLTPLGTEVALSLGKVQLARNNARQARAAFEHVLRWSRNEGERTAATMGLARVLEDR
jgi:tetratricopeptide (TPR) repeat protein